MVIVKPIEQTTPVVVVTPSLGFDSLVSNLSHYLRFTCLEDVLGYIYQDHCCPNRPQAFICFFFLISSSERDRNHGPW